LNSKKSDEIREDLDIFAKKVKTGSYRDSEINMYRKCQKQRNIRHPRKRWIEAGTGLKSNVE
jgi:hypothetical protein